MADNTNSYIADQGFELPKESILKDFVFVNNYDFYKDLNMISFLREVGVHFRLSTMLSRDSVKSRLQASNADEGMSFTEFSY